MHYPRRWMKQVLVLLFFSNFPGSALANDPDLIKQMQTGHAVLMVRHALAPGVGDPENFSLEDCSTQRNLNAAGREQARAMGQWLRHRGIKQVKLYSSQWCRCLETARLMQIGRVTPLPALNSFFQRPEDREPHLSALRQFIIDNTKPGELIIMVTHQVTISAITGQWTDSGHGKLLRPTKTDGIEVLAEVDFEQ